MATPKSAEWRKLSDEMTRQRQQHFKKYMEGERLVTEEDVGRAYRRSKDLLQRSLSGSAREPLISAIARANTNLDFIARKRGMSPEDKAAESAKWLQQKHEAEQKLAKMPAAEQRGIQEGTRGGRYYVSPTGSKVYVKSNPGAETVGQLSNQRFVGGLPVSCHMAEPRRRG